MSRTSLISDPAMVLGLISGTSADGVDAALVRLGTAGGDELRRVELELLAARTTPYSRDLQARVVSVAALRTPELAALNAEIGERFAEAALDLCRAAKVAVESVDLIASHGQTVWHDPRPGDGRAPTTLQIGEAAVIAARTGRDVVADFRAADVALGGEGAPLVPYVDHLLLSRPGVSRAVLNIGGIANVTWLPAGGGEQDVVAFDTGPGNMLLDGLVRRYRLSSTGFDAGGELARQGHVHDGLLADLLRQPFFDRPPPRSTGRELFGAAFLESLCSRGVELGLTPPDLLATAVALTCRSVADALVRFCGRPDELLLCGGGRRNAALREGLRQVLPQTAVGDTDDAGLDGDAKEAIAFAVLGFLAARGASNHLPHTTGARRRTILGKFVWGAGP